MDFGVFEIQYLEQRLGVYMYEGPTIEDLSWKRTGFSILDIHSKRVAILSLEPRHRDGLKPIHYF